MQRFKGLNRSIRIVSSNSVCFQPLISNYRWRCFTTKSKQEGVSSLDIFEFMNAIFNGGKGGGINEKSLSDESRLKEVFDQIDLDGSGELDEDEFSAAARVCSMGISDNQINGVFTSMDTDKNGTISLSEFTAAINTLSSSALSINSDEFAKSDESIQNIIIKWDQYMNGNTDAAKMFTDILLNSKELEDLENVEIDRQVHMVYGMISNTFRALTHIDKLKERLEKEGTRHFGRFAMEPHHVKICGKALFETLPVILGDQYDKKTQEDFEIYWLIIEESLIGGLNKIVHPMYKQ